MTRDPNPNAATVRRAVEEFGSVAHLAKAISVPPQQIYDWLSGAAEIPPASYQAILDAVAARKR